MNMVATSENLFKQKYSHHKFKNYTNNSTNNGGDLMEESRSSNNNNNNEETVGSSSRDQEDHDHHGWLQLSIGNSGGGGSGGGSGGERVEVINRTSGGLVELDLINSRRSTEQERQDHQIVRLEPLMMTQTTMFPYQMPNLNAFLIQQHQEQNQEQGGAMNWGYNSNRPMMIMAPPQSFLPSSSSGGGGNMRVIDPPRRANSGIWFMLQAMQTQARQPYLPQISKTYLRIKDGRMTVRLLMKYLVRKLSLDSESEIEIRCRGHEIEGNWTLQHVRDNIWNQTSSFTIPHSSTTNVTDHLMLLHYGRRSAPP